jgi:hypothetical protein
VLVGETKREVSARLRPDANATQSRRACWAHSGPDRLMRSDTDVITAATRSADLLRKGRALLLSLVDHAAAWTARVNTLTARIAPGDVDALLIRPNGCVGACAGNLARTTGLSTTLMIVSDSLDRNSPSDKRCTYVGG